MGPFSDFHCQKPTHPHPRRRWRRAGIRHLTGVSYSAEEAGVVLSLPVRFLMRQDARRFALALCPRVICPPPNDEHSDCQHYDAKSDSGSCDPRPVSLSNHDEIPKGCRDKPYNKTPFWESSFHLSHLLVGRPPILFIGGCEIEMHRLEVNHLFFLYVERSMGSATTSETDCSTNSESYASKWPNPIGLNSVSGPCRST